MCNRYHMQQGTHETGDKCSREHMDKGQMYQGTFAPGIKRRKEGLNRVEVTILYSFQDSGLQPDPFNCS
jgi:hypothetical protein